MKLDDIICKIFDIWLWLLVLRISWAHSDGDRQPTANGRIEATALNQVFFTFDLSLFGFVDIFLVVGNNSL